MPIGSVRFGVLHEVRIAIVQAVIIEAHVGLFPLDHAVRVVAQDHDRDMKTQSYGRFYFLLVHHKTTVTANRGHRFFGVNQFGSDRRW